ncbi:peptidoglycan-binding protein [Streptomyces sp. NPDC093970]|uniref:peptidoglycan-binding protein n=1 Tax=Streptomyces sp. NPDC093970 TaxID=3155076 RepID=UPI00343B71CA
MPRFKPLPAELDPSAAQLVVRLRELKEHGELTMRRLAADTGYSSRSWERYLGGTSLPPRAAVEALARVTGADPVRLLALHEVAAASWDIRRAEPSVQSRPTAQEPQERLRPEHEKGERREQEREQKPLPGPMMPVPGTAVTPKGPADSPAEESVPRRLPHIALTAGVAALAVALTATLLLVLRLGEDVTPAAVASPAGAAPAAPQPSYTCRITRADGRWSAGVNNGRDAEITYGDTGADVAEAQCLLRRAGISPGGIDGMFGPLTLRAVKTFQDREGLVVDGMLGPRSWKALRG